MNSHYPDPSLTPELEKEAVMKMVKILQDENKKLKETVKNQNQTIEKQNDEIAQWKKRYCRREFIKATKIENIYRPVRRDDYYEGVVITPPLKYEATNKYNRSRIDSFNWIYSPKLGLIRSINEGEIEMQFARFYYFNVNDERLNVKNKTRWRGIPHMEALRAIKSEERMARRASRIENGKIVFHISFQFDSSMLYDDKTVYLEDQYLNRVHLNSKMMSRIFQMADTSNIQGGLVVEAKVGLKEKFLEKFQQNPNNPIFEVVEVKEVKFESGKVVEARESSTGRISYHTLSH